MGPPGHHAALRRRRNVGDALLMPLRLSAVIPTRNRPDDLERAVATVYGQTRLPEELLIIDQSPDGASRSRIEALAARHSGKFALVYVLDPAIKGLVQAKQVAAARAGGDIVCFLEDDLLLDPGYFAAVEIGFRARPEMLGCCGLVVSLPAQPAGYVGLFQLFHRGIYRDPRVGVHGHLHGENLPLIPSDCLSGGLSSWRREVFAQVPFDVGNEFFMLEDIDYSKRAQDEFGPRFFINPNARVDHRLSPLNREQLGARQRRKLREVIVFYKKRTARPGALPQLVWLLFGLLLDAAAQSARTQSATPLAGYFAGIADGLRWQLRGEAA
jgi:glycosyltransferase involved in cell wall biosynthesis